MKKEERNRLTNELRYLKGCIEMLSWVMLSNPSDVHIENTLTKIEDRAEDIEAKLKPITNN